MNKPEVTILILAARKEMEAKRLKTAIELTKRAAEISPYEPEIYEMLGMFFAMSDQAEEGEEFFTAKLGKAIWPCFFTARVGCRMALGKYPEALADIEFLLALKSRDSVMMALFYRFCIRLDQEDLKVAIRDAEEIIAFPAENEVEELMQKRIRGFLEEVEFFKSKKERIKIEIVFPSFLMN